MVPGLRHVRPYTHSFTACAKARWYGQTLVQLYTNEFVAYDAAYYRHAIATGRIRVHGRAVALEHRIANGDVITHSTHRHEPPVLARPAVSVVHADARVVVVNKPPSIPVHPCGRYRHNSLLYILAKEFGLHLNCQCSAPPARRRRRCRRCTPLSLASPRLIA